MAGQMHMTRIRVFVLSKDILTQQMVSIMAGNHFDVQGIDDPQSCPVFRDAGCNCLDDSACCDILIAYDEPPRFNALDFIEAQAQRGCKGPAARKAAILAYSSDEDLARAQKLGVCTFARPVDWSEFLSWLESLRGSPAAGGGCQGNRGENGSGD